MRIDFDESKSEWLKQERGMTLGEAAHVFSGHYVTDLKNDDPEQYRVVGYAHGTLIALIFEYRLDAMDTEFMWLVTYWKATSQERIAYVKNS